MCGIAGLLRLTDPQPQENVIREMVRLVAHRGPDGEGVYLRDRVALGHRRLSIIDLEGGTQPMGNEDGQVWVTYNGEIYNFRELRSRLIACGHVFRTNCDTEVIVHAYEQWGADCVKQLRGMFAFAVADFRERRLLLARDHIGIKPLYVRYGDQYVAFASEIRALLAADAQLPRPRPQAIDYFLRYRYIPHPDTVYENIQKLPPAHYQEFDFEGRSAGPQRYWQLEYCPTKHVSDDEWFERFAHTVRESVRAHLVADVPFGAFLSGGIDSTLVAMEMSQILERPVKAFTIGFDEEEYSEIPYAKAAARQLGIELCAEVVRPDVVGILDQLVSHYGEPFADTSAIPTWCVSRLARSEVPMILSGDGGDETFAGYHHYESWSRIRSRRFWSDLRMVFTHPRPLVRRLLAWLRSSETARYSKFADFLARPAKQRAALWRPEYRHLVERPCPAFIQAARRAHRLDPLTHAQYIDYHTYLPADILTKVDVASMYHGLEVRTPLTDVRVAEFAATLPLRQRCRLAGRGAMTMKVLPKRRVGQRFSSSFVNRRKMGFAIPEIEWLRRGSPVRDRLDGLIASPDSPVFEFLDEGEVRRLASVYDETGEGAIPLWLVLILGTWFEQQSGISVARRAA